MYILQRWMQSRHWGLLASYFSPCGLSPGSSPIYCFFRCSCWPQFCPLILGVSPFPSLPGNRGFLTSLSHPPLICWRSLTCSCASSWEYTFPSDQSYLPDRAKRSKLFSCPHFSCNGVRSRWLIATVIFLFSIKAIAGGNEGIGLAGEKWGIACILHFSLWVNGLSWKSYGLCFDL